MDDSPALDVERICAVIESMLLVSSEPLPVDRVREIVIAEAPATDPGAVDLAVEALLTRYADPERPLGRGIRLDMVADGLQLRTPADSAPFLRRLLAARPPKLTKPAMETLAVIAYRQPVTKPEIESIRGVDVGAVLKALLDRDLIRIIGKSEDLGRPILYGTTKKFLELFGLRSLGALPTLREYHELDEVHQQHVDELYEDSRPRISDLAAKAAFLVERTHDADLDALASAEASAEAAGLRTAAVLRGDAEAPTDPPPPPEVAAAPASTEAAADAVPRGRKRRGRGESAPTTEGEGPATEAAASTTEAAAPTTEAAESDTAPSALEARDTEPPPPSAPEGATPPAAARAKSPRRPREPRAPNPDTIGGEAVDGGGPTASLGDERPTDAPPANAAAEGTGSPPSPPPRKTKLRRRADPAQETNEE